MKPAIFGQVTQSPDHPDFYRLPDSKGHFLTRIGAGNGGSTRRYGRKPLIAFMMLVIDEWNTLHPGHPLPVGDLAEPDGSSQKDHVTHDDGLSVDIYNLHTNGGQRKGAPYAYSATQHPDYGRELMIKLCTRIMARKSVFRMAWVYHNDPDLRKQVNAAYPAWPRISKKYHHEDHIHVSLHPDHKVTDDQLNAILGLADLGKAVDKAIEELMRTGQMLRFGVRGALVTALQIAMNVIAETQGTKQGRLAQDGAFGPKTNGRVKEFQMLNRLSADGIVGPRTKQEIQRQV